VLVAKIWFAANARMGCDRSASAPIDNNDADTVSCCLIFNFDLLIEPFTPDFENQLKKFK
jgi:hypothetical protein